ncbi:uncharacterized protein LOC135143007 [Zophobas morio]|uniref:uncharacterized protein LOC135143007 n=1 Tax=Zophobas morio TaxID=2755281 RepID=UPI003082B7A3
MNKQIIEGPKLTYFIKEKTFGEFCFNRCEKYGDNICHIDATDNKTETYSSVKLRSTRVAIALQKKGITSKDIVTFCSSNTLDNAISIIASAFLGATISNLESSLSVRHTTHLLRLVEPSMIFVEEAAISLIEESLDGANFKPEIIVFGKSEKYTVFSDLLKQQDCEEEFRPVQVDPNGLAIMYFSSGTTGLPKAISHTHNSFMFFISVCCEATPYQAALHFTTFYWMTAMMLMFCCFENGSYRVFGRNPSAEDIFRFVEKYKVATIFTAPIITYKLTSFENSHKYDTSSLKYVMCGGTPMAASQLVNVRNLFKGAYVGLGYGMSEVGVVAAMNSKNDPKYSTQKLTSCGTPAAGLKLKIVDIDTEQLLGPNQKGEICIFSPSLMQGYYKLDSSEVFDKDGFLKTGDVGYYDEDGYLYVVERIKEMFKYQSWHIVPSAIEAVLLEHKGVKEAAVFGLPGGEDGEVPAACVVLKDGYSLSEEEIDSFLKERIADRERLRGGITFVKTLPKTPTGKVVRKKVRDSIINSKKCPL